MKPIRAILLALICLATVMSSSGSTIRRPDFAFPEKVSSTARQELRAALAAGDEVGALRAALNLTLAQNIIDSDRMPEMLASLDSLAEDFSSPAPRAVCDLIRATIYTDYYRSQQWTIDQRPELPAGTPPPADYTEWDAARFEARVSELLNSAMAMPEALLATPLRTYDPLLAVASKDARVIYTFYPSLLDFVGGQAIDLLSSFRTQQARQLADEYRQTLIRLNAANPAPLIVQKISAIMSSSISSDQMLARLYDLYSAFASSQYSGEILISIGNLTDADDIDRCRELKLQIDSFLQRYPSYIRAANLRNLIASLTRGRAQIDYRTLVVPGADLGFSVKAYNTSELTVTLYRLPDTYTDTGDEYYKLKNGVIPPTFRKVASKTLTFQGEAPFMAEGSGEISVAEAGLYILVANAPGMNRDTNPRIIRATSLAPGSLVFGKVVSALVVNPLTGQPVADARIIRCDKSTADLGSTDADGMLQLGQASRGMIFRPVKGADTFAPRTHLWFANDGGIDTTRHYYVEAYTDLGLYHPGDTVRFAAILYSIREREISVTPGEEIEAIIFDANRQPIDTVKAVTDRFGRIEGTALLPDDGRLNGRYYLSVNHHNASGRAYFTVSDYKLPSFEVVIDPARNGVPEKGAVTLSGRVMTYSGMPVADADISVRIEREYIWRYGLDGDTGFTPLDLTARTDADGRWSIVLTPARISGAGENAWFSASVTATSPSGESQAARTVFALGPSLRIRAALPVSIDVTDPVALPVEVYGPSGTAVDSVKVDYSVVPESGTDAAPVASGSFLSNKPVVDLSAIAPGTYTLTFTIDGDSRSCRGIALYRPDVDRSPSADLLWTPDNSVTLSPGAGTDILIGTSMDSTWVLYTLYDFERIIERRWLVLPAGLHRIKTAAEHGGSPDLRASFIATGRYTTRQLDINIRPAVDPRGLTLRAETMRDHLTPGSAEKWTFKVVNALGTPVEAAVMVDMYNKALDALVSSRWSIHVNPPRSMHLSANYPSTGNLEWIYLAANSNRYLRGVDYSLPDFQLYGQTLAPQTWRRGHGVMMKARMMKSAATGAASSDDVVAVEEVMMDMAADNGMAAPPKNIAMRGAAKVESAEEEGVDANAMGSGTDESAPFAYRDAETPLALFRPMLSTGRDGTLELTFTVPDANATWAFQALAFTDDMRAARLDASVIASKPVMVKPNLPRFLREGDTAEALTTVMNATDSLMQVEVLTEIFDPLSGKTVSRQVESVAIEGGASAVVSTRIEAAPGLAMLGFRVKASTPSFADGEQDMIAILPSAQPVIDSESFYMGPDTDQASISLPAASDASEAMSTLEFCGNPVWYVVTALPGLAASDPVSSPSAADALFSAVMARGLIGRYPVIASALADWTSRGSDSEELTSMLQRNQDLKTILLNATPWMADAMTDTDRMRRLSLLFDSKRVDKSITDALGVLTKLQQPDGGMAWIASEKRSSLWATYTVLSRLAILNSYGFINGKSQTDSRLLDLISKAIGYIDSEAAKIYREHPDAPQTEFAQLRTLFPGIKTTTAIESILANATQAVVKGWKTWPLDSRPEAAMMLWRRDYKSVARDILSSLREFMVSSPDKGSYFPSLQNQASGYILYTARALSAFSLIDPGCREIDGLRQWLVIQKQATDWGSSPGATEVVAAILSSSQSWLSDADGASVTVNGKKLSLPEADSRLGYFRIPLPIAPDKDIDINIIRKGSAPAWGAIIRRAVAPLRSIAASTHPDISIEKSIIAPDTLTPGDKVTVRLVIRTSRNLNYVTITDDRAACFEPVDPLPSMRFVEGVPLYMEPRDSRTSIFITTMPKGTFVISYDMYVNNAGSFASGIATVASQYAPDITAHSAGSVINVNPAAK